MKKSKRSKFKEMLRIRIRWKFKKSSCIKIWGGEGLSNCPLVLLVLFCEYTTDAREQDDKDLFLGQLWTKDERWYFFILFSSLRTLRRNNFFFCYHKIDNCWISSQVMADMKKVYGDLIIINLYMSSFLRSIAQVYTELFSHFISWTNWVNLWKIAEFHVNL